MKTAKKSNSTILVLPSWYPSEADTSSGDFIERHIEAIATQRNQYVIFVTKLPSGQLGSENKKIVPIEGKGFQGQIIYYKSIRTGIPWLDPFLSDRKYIRLYKQAIKRYFREAGKPSFIHVHVAQKAGRLAVWAKKKWKIPFLVSEHWTGYLPEADLKINDFPYWFRNYNRKIIAAADGITAVSEHLGKALKHHYPFIKNFTRIPNVVKLIPISDDRAQENSVPVFIHASTMGYQKNVEDILEAMAILKVLHPNFLLRLFGPSHSGIHAKIRDLGLRDHVRLEGNVPHEQLLKAMTQATALIAYSRFETFGCVVIEANAAGIPAIVSDIPVFHELVTDSVNGSFVLGEHPPALAQTLEMLLDAKLKFDSSILQQSAHPYNYEAVGKSFVAVFNQLNSSRG